MPWEIVIATVIVIALLLLPFVLLYLRRRWLTGQGGLFDCAYRMRDDTPGAGWVLGVARYRGESLEWFRAFSLSFSPKLVLERTGSTFLTQRVPSGVEAIALFDDSVVITLKERASERVHTLSMAPDDVLGLMSWLESAPPGSNYLPGSGGSPH